jgi:hypothetical protein
MRYDEPRPAWTSRGLRGLICPSRTSEREVKGDFVKERGREEGEHVKKKKRALGLKLNESDW